MDEHLIILLRIYLLSLGLGRVVTSFNSTLTRWVLREAEEWKIGGMEGVYDVMVALYLFVIGVHFIRWIGWSFWYGGRSGKRVLPFWIFSLL